MRAGEGKSFWSVARRPLIVVGVLLLVYRASLGNFSFLNSWYGLVYSSYFNEDSSFLPPYLLRLWGNVFLLGLCSAMILSAVDDTKVQPDMMNWLESTRYFIGWAVICAAPVMVPFVVAILVAILAAAVFGLFIFSLFAAFVLYMAIYHKWPLSVEAFRRNNRNVQWWLLAFLAFDTVTFLTFLPYSYPK